MSITSVVYISTLTFSNYNSGGTRISRAPSRAAPTAATMDATSRPATRGCLRDVNVSATALKVGPGVVRSSGPINFRLSVPGGNSAVTIIRASCNSVAVQLFPRRTPGAIAGFMGLTGTKGCGGSLFDGMAGSFVVGNNCYNADSCNRTFRSRFYSELFGVENTITVSGANTSAGRDTFFVGRGATRACGGRNN